MVTRLAQRADLVPLKAQVEIAGPGPVTNVEGIANGVHVPSRASLQQQLGAGLDGLPRSGTVSFSLPVAAVTLSAAARAVSAILDGHSGDMPKIRGNEPLWAHRRAPVAQLLALNLARAVETSGLFYESHLKQYAAGTRTLAQLVLEPQARLDATENVSPKAPHDQTAGTRGPVELTNFPAIPDLPEISPAEWAHAPPSGDAISTDSTPGATAKGIVGLMRSNEAVTGPAATSQPAQAPERQESVSFATPYSSLSQKEYLAVAGMVEKQSTDQSAADSLIATGETSAPSSGIHPEAIAIVRQQLEMLATPVFRWEGEAWRGTPMDWAIHQEYEEPQATSESEAVQRVWTTRLMMTLPALRDVEVHVILTDTKLQVRLAARQNATVDLLGAAGGALQKRFEALGLNLSGLRVGSLAAQQLDEHGGSQEVAGASAGVEK